MVEIAVPPETVSRCGHAVAVVHMVGPAMPCAKSVVKVLSSLFVDGVERSPCPMPERD